jgi:hypothetical protein
MCKKSMRIRLLPASESRRSSGDAEGFVWLAVFAS